jgi:DNA replication and repair protein RecF
LQLQQLSIVQFKNYIQQRFEFTERITGICGKNGIGKTNLLDAVYYLGFTKSYFTKTDAANTHHGATGFRIEGVFEKEANTHKVVCILRETGKKEFYYNEQAYDKMAQHIGRFPAVFIAPDDVHIITEGSEERRRFMDALFSQLDSHYLQQLMEYNKVLQQKNSYLKLLAERSVSDYSLLDVYDAQLVKTGSSVYEKRNAYLQQLLPLAGTFYQQIAGVDEGLELAYQTSLHQYPMQQLLQQNRDKDIAAQRTTQGIHRDDIGMSFSGEVFKTTASQGQRKSLLFALKLAEFEMLKITKGFAPLLLLDDVFEKLDASRMHNLLQWVCVQNNGQVLITDTHKERLQQHLAALQKPFQLIEL